MAPRPPYYGVVVLIFLPGRKVNERRVDSQILSDAVNSV